jgi:HEAT repeat protein
MKRILTGFLLTMAAHAADDLPARMLDLKATVAQRNDACFALRGNRSADAIAALRTALADSVVRTCAAQDLRQAGALEALLQAVDSDDADIQAVAARELGEMHDPRALPALGHAALDSNVLVASAAIDALAAYGEGPALPLLLQAARQPGLAGVTALERAAAFHNPAVLPVARQVLAKADAASKVIALGVIGDLGDELDLPKLREMAARPDPVASRGRGFGFMPVIDLARVAQNAIVTISARMGAAMTAR